MEPVEILPGIRWTGVLDPQLRVFDVIMRAEHGTTYNSYLVEGAEKVAVIEASKAKFTDQYLETLGKAVDPARIDYVVLNHLEPDHSGALGALLERAPRARVVVSKTGRVFLQNVLNRDVDPLTVGDGDTLELGGRTLRFFHAPFLHWPDTMFTYAEEDGVLFPGDFLGAHYCDDRLFNDRVDDHSGAFEHYFRVIMRPFKEYVRQGLEKIRGLPLRTVCPSHGPILRTGIERCLERYETWSAEPPRGDRKRLLVFYASSYGNTARMAEAVARGAEAAGAEVAVYSLQGHDLGVALDEIEAADGLAVGSCTINGDALEHVWALFGAMATIKVKGKLGAAFGSFGWSGEGPRMIADRMRGLRFRVPEEPVRVQLVPTEEDLAACEAFGMRLIETL
ncbi:MAG: FprA family A-type flavoprotein [Deferrisomatales bacterium]|nr:FprA family A-type flavoprotein [Deferrisomatales bacterium]